MILRRGGVCMRKPLFLFLAFVLLLTACTQLPPAETTQPSSIVPLTTSATQTPTAPPTETPTEPALFDGDVTAGGYRVHTDTSAYQPYVPPKAVYTRLADGPLESFIPSPDYGEVYPYIAAHVFGSEGNDGWRAGSCCGIVDRNGRILTDGIYSGIRTLSNWDYEHNSVRYLPFWVVQKVLGVTRHEEADADLSWLEDDTRMGVISLDGSFALPCEYKSIQAAGDGFVAYRSWDKPDFEVYDGSGTLLFTGADIFDGSKADSWSIHWGDGLYLAGNYSNEDESVYWYLRPDGSRTLGPYSSAEPFQEGLACVSADGESYGYIDKEGNWVIEPVYETAASFWNGRVIQKTKESQTVVLDKSGNRLLTCEDDWLYDAPCGFRSEGNWDDTVTYYDRDGSVLCSGGYNLCCLDAETFYEELDDCTRVFRLDGRELRMPLVDYLSTGIFLVDGQPTPGYVGRSYQDEVEYFLPQDLSAAAKQISFDTESPNVYFTCFDTQDEITNQTWHFSWNGRAWLGSTDEGDTLTVPLRAPSPRVFGDRINAELDQASVYLDLEGNIVFYYPLDAED